MKTIGLIGGMSWESTIPYYKIINERINQKLGKNHSAQCLIYSFDFQQIEDLQYKGDWDSLKNMITAAGTSLKSAGADCLALCTNTMHKVADSIEKDVGLPFIHIVDAVGEAVASRGIKKIGLLGTIFTMEQDFYKDILTQKYGLSVIIPQKDDRYIVNSIIYEELVKGIIKPESCAAYTKIMDGMAGQGAEGIILGCTEIGLLVQHYSLPLFDTTAIHAEKIADYIN